MASNEPRQLKVVFERCMTNTIFFFPFRIILPTPNTTKGVMINYALDLHFIAISVCITLDITTSYLADLAVPHL